MSNYADFVRRLGTNEESDECYTPENAAAPLFPFLDKTKTYYEATSGLSSSLVRGLRAGGFSVVESDGADFLSLSAGDIHDGTITNPPYSKKTVFLAHLYKLGKPFAILLPVSAIQGQARGKMFMEHGISLLVYNRRVDFTGKKAPPFGVAWYMGCGMCEPGRVWFTNN